VSSRSGTAVISEDRPVPVPEPRRGRIGRVVVLSLLVGLVAALTLPFLPVPTVDENSATGMVLIGFALGWAVLAVASTRWTDQPQRWAVAPAVFMGLAGAMALLLPDGVLDALGWVWPPALLALVVWVFGRAKRDLHSRTRGWLLNPVLAVLVLVSLGGAYETVSRASDPDLAMRGRLVDVGPYRLHLECAGSGGPTVILQPGLGGSAATLARVAPAVARDGSVCIYDRAGRGWSDPAQSPPDGAQVAADLHTLLERAHVPGPYVLAGHSFGGLYVMSFAEQYPEQVAGLVLIDSTAPKSTPVTRQDAGSYSVIKHFSALVSTTARVGVGRLIAQADFADLPAQSRDEARASASTAMEMASFIDEFAVGNRSESEAGELVDLDGKPLVVLTADLGNAAGWTEAQDQLALLSTDSVHRVVTGATHESLMVDPEHAAEVIRAIREVVGSVRTERPLTDR
jgi:pimeloyl-ACP methyl ester carboxylesterase